MRDDTDDFMSLGDNIIPSQIGIHLQADEVGKYWIPHQVRDDTDDFMSLGDNIIPSQIGIHLRAVEVGNYWIPHQVRDDKSVSPVIPAKAGILLQAVKVGKDWIPHRVRDDTDNFISLGDYCHSRESGNPDKGARLRQLPDLASSAG